MARQPTLAMDNIPIQVLGVSFFEFFVIFSLSVRLRTRPGLPPSVPGLARPLAVRPLLRPGLRPFVLGLGRLCRTPLALTWAPADGPRHRSLFWPFALGLDLDFRRPSSASSGFSPSAPSFGGGSHQPSPALAGFSQFVPVSTGQFSRRPSNFAQKIGSLWSHVHSLASVKVSKFMKQIMTRPFLTTSSV